MAGRSRSGPLATSIPKTSVRGTMIGHRGLTELEDAVDHLALFALDHALLMANLDQGEAPPR